MREPPVASRESPVRCGGGRPALRLPELDDWLAGPAASWCPAPIDRGVDRGALESWCRARGFTLLDRLADQLAELARVRDPGGDAAVASFVERRCDGGAEPYAGTWFCFGWARTLVRLLDEDDYFAVITSRNRDKIEAEEQAALREKAIGVIGLSVGGEIAVTLAQEHLCGRIALADFDRLDLSNLNRLNGGVDELGENKAHLAARRIARIDPYLEVEVFDEGVTDSSLDRFLDGLDLLVEECDDLAMKHRLRLEARERSLDVVFAADERGMLSIEPYGHAEIEPFHGLASAPPPRESFASTRAFMRELTRWLGGWDAISERSRRSVEAIGETLAGYPQLASEPRFAAGQVAHVARRLLLGERIPPTFLQMDLDELVPGPGRPET